MSRATSSSDINATYFPVSDIIWTVAFRVRPYRLREHCSAEIFGGSIFIKCYHLNTTHTRFVSLFGRESFYFKHFSNKIEKSYVYLINKYEFILVCEF